MSFFSDFEDELIEINKINRNAQTTIPEANSPSLETLQKSTNITVKFKNKLFERINRPNKNNWVDIENDYYNALLEILDRRAIQNRYYSVDKLNRDFEKITSKIEEYLITIENGESYDSTKVFNNAKETIQPIFHPGYYLRDLSNKAIQQKVTSEIEKIEILQLKPVEYELDEAERSKLDFVKKNTPISRVEVEAAMYGGPNTGPFNLSIQKQHVLTFNYTNTCKYYTDSKKGLDFYTIGSISHIHGNLEEPSKIIFGFGDEMDSRYIDLENDGDDGYLKKVKSISYLKNDIYRHELLRFVNEGNFQIYILGHSCGNSDRTLLNTLFEHENCCSIKVFYHQYEKDGIIQDDFTQKSINLTRCFKDKAKLREIVVNKEFCRPLVPVEMDNTES